MIVEMISDHSASQLRSDVRRAIIDGDLDSAGAMLDRLLASDPEDAAAYMLAGRLAAARRDLAGELAMMREAVEHDPANGDYRAFLARCFAKASAMEQALTAIDEALARDPLSDLALDAIAGTFSQFGRHGEAAAMLDRAAKEGSRNPAIYFNLGNALRFTGDFPGARSAFEQALTLAPQFHKAHAALTALGGITAEHNNLSRLVTLIAESDDPRARIHLCHAAAKECEALGRFDEAWHYLETGKAALRAVVPNDPEQVIASMARLETIAGNTLAKPVTGASEASPIFIVGMPRSGTTVLDRIVSNHSEVTSIGESLYFAQLLKKACGSTSNQLLDDAILGALTDDANLADIGHRYVERGRMMSRGAARFLDKFHLNFMLAGHLMRALPNARILCLVRNPLDTITSNFRQLFEFESALYAYSLDVMATTNFYIRFRRLAAMWEELAPERFRTVRYEALVGNPDEEAAGLLAHCCLGWEEGLTAIERNTASVATASAVQVRSKIHGGSIGSWRRYERHLDAARERLAEAGLPADC